MYETVFMHGLISSFGMCEATDSIKEDNMTNGPQMQCGRPLHTVLDSLTTFCGVETCWLERKKKGYNDSFGFFFRASVKKCDGLENLLFQGDIEENETIRLQ